jgi:hypothetical protein
MKLLIGMVRDLEPSDWPGSRERSTRQTGIGKGMCLLRHRNGQTTRVTFTEPRASAFGQRMCNRHSPRKLRDDAPAHHAATTPVGSCVSLGSTSSSVTHDLVTSSPTQAHRQPASPTSFCHRKQPRIRTPASHRPRRAPWRIGARALALPRLSARRRPFRLRPAL